MESGIAIRRAPGQQSVTLLDQTDRHYVFASGAEGYFITPTDSRFQPLLAYVDHGTFDPNPAMQCLLDQYDAQMAAGVEAAVTLDDLHSQWADITPIVGTKWNQTGAYNHDIPNRAPCGCVSLAMAQVIYHHKYQTENPAERVHTYTPNTMSTALSYDYTAKGARFNYDEMSPVVNGSYEPGVKAVSDLTLATAISVNSDFASGGTGAADGNIAPALINNFGYDADGTMRLVKSQMGDVRFEQMLYNELQNNRPVIICANEVASGFGHCFFTEGYRKGGYFYINWGWGGQDNGYFTLPLLTPPAAGGNWSNGMSAVTVVPPTNNKNLFITSPRYTGTLSLVANGNVEASFTMSESGRDIYGKPALKAIDEGGMANYFLIYNDAMTLRSYIPEYKTIAKADLATILSDGKWIVSPAVQVDGRYFDCEEELSRPFSLTVDIDGTSVSVKSNAVNVHMVEIVNCTTYPEAIPTTGGTVEFCMELANTISEQFNKQLVIVISTDGTNEGRVFEPLFQSINLGPGEQKEFEFNQELFVKVDKNAKGKEESKETTPVPDGWYRINLFAQTWDNATETTIFTPMSTNYKLVKVGNPGEYVDPVVPDDPIVTPEDPVTVTLDKTELNLFVDDTATITATVTPAGKTVTWTCDNTSVCKVDNGTIYAVGPGKCTITAACGDIKATCAVAVSTKPVSSLDEVNAAAAATAYDLQGRRIASPCRGLYIVNGKKTRIK